MLRIVLVACLLAVSSLGDARQPDTRRSGEAEFNDAWAKVMKALPDAWKLGSQISSETIENVKKALRKAAERNSQPRSSQDQVAETEELLLKIEELGKQLGPDVLNDVNRTVKELNALSESIE